MFFGQDTMKTLCVISGAEAQQEKPVSRLEPRQREHGQARLAGRPRSRRGQCTATRGIPGARDAGVNLAWWDHSIPGCSLAWGLPLQPQNGAQGPARCSSGLQLKGRVGFF